MIRRLAALAVARFWERVDARIEHLLALAALGELPLEPPGEPEPLPPETIAAARRLLEPNRNR